MSDLRFARPKIFFQVLYPALLVASAAAAAVLASTASTTNQKPTQKCYTQAFQATPPARSGGNVGNAQPPGATTAQVEKYLACRAANG